MKEKNYRAKFKQREHRCWDNPREDTCVNLFRVTDEDAPEERTELVDEDGKFYHSIFTFKENAPINKRKMTDCYKERIVCKETECERYELLTERCLKTHKSLFHGDQKFEDGHRPIEHRCSMEKGKLTCSTLIETNTEGLPKYVDEGGVAYKDIESFRDRSELPEIEIQECQRKRKGNTQSSSEEGRTMKVRITNRNYQINEEEWRRNMQEEERIEADTLRDLPCMFND